MEGIVRCVTEKGQERFIPVKMTKDSALMKQYGLTVQDLGVETTKFETAKDKTEEYVLDNYVKVGGKTAKSKTVTEQTDGIPNE